MSAKINDSQMRVMVNIIGAVETGGQVYGVRRYDDFTEAFANSPNEVSITIGAFQEYYWYAKALLQDILDAYPDTFRRLDGAGIEDDLKIPDWKGYRPKKGSAKAKAIQKIISSKEGIGVQDRRIAKLIEGYVGYAAGLGVTDVDALLMCANFVHQGGESACKRIVAKTKRPYTLDNIYAACQTDTGTQVGAYRPRQKMVYEALKKHVTPTMAGGTSKNGGTAMTKLEAIGKVVDVAASYVGYLEKASNKDLDDFTANAGMDNYTRFARDYKRYTGDDLQGQAWCAMFVSCVFVETFGLEDAKKLLGGSLFAYTPTGASNMGAKAGITPKKGDVVFFFSSSMGRISHVGLVTGVDGERFYTVEGNTSGDAGVVRNGGGVFRKSYALHYPSARFATPCYDSLGVAQDTNQVANQVGGKEIAAIAKEVIDGGWGTGDARRQKLAAAGYDYLEVQQRVNAMLMAGIAQPPKGNPYIEPGVNVTSAANAKARGIQGYVSNGEPVKWVQWELCQESQGLKASIMLSGGIDGICGQGTVDCIREYQRIHGLAVDGVCGAKTRAMMKN